MRITRSDTRFAKQEEYLGTMYGHPMFYRDGRRDMYGIQRYPADPRTVHPRLPTENSRAVHSHPKWFQNDTRIMNNGPMFSQRDTGMQYGSPMYASEGPGSVGLTPFYSPRRWSKEDARTLNGDPRWSKEDTRSTHNDRRWSKADLLQLQKKAEYFLQHVSPYKGCTRMEYITREKDPEYYADIFHNARGVMRKYRKDLYGNPRNPINGRLDGLFFRAVVDPRTGLPYPSSPYGSCRLMLPASYLVTPDKHLYFCDFYCMHKGKSGKVSKHTITLVLCEAGSASDAFCRRALPRLDIHNNPFLYISPHDNAVYVTNGRKDGAYVELFNTEHMSIEHLRGCFTKVEEFGNGRCQNPNKNTSCQHCNLPETSSSSALSDLNSEVELLSKRIQRLLSNG